MSNLREFNLALLGCGRMGSALAQGVVRGGAVDPAQLCCIDVDERTAAALARELGATVGPPTEGKTIWVVAVKPHHVAGALSSIVVGSDDVVVCVAAGITLAAIRAQLPTATPVVRAMPNTPALVGEGITGVLADDGWAEVADQLFGAVGAVAHLGEEKHFDAVTAVSGSGPAYVFVAIEALADGGVAMGLPRDIALQLATQTVLGAAALARAEDVHVAELKDRVASPGGTTIAGLTALERGGFRAALIDAVRAATERSRELGKDP